MIPAPRMNRQVVFLAGLFTASNICFAVEPKSKLTIKLPKAAVIAGSAQELMWTIERAPPEEWKPRVNTDAARGPAADVYPKVAPATVVIRTPFGSGTGSIIDPEGWVITNHHVIDLATSDEKTGAQVVALNLGSLKEGHMELIEEEVPALVYKSDKNKDLALLKMLGKPRGVRTLPAIAMAKSPAKTADGCIVVGHPRAGMLWTVRSGEISGRGEWPKHLVNVVISRLAAKTPEEKKRISELLSSSPQVKVLISSCSINHGDSGGPLVNEAGELIGVTYAMPVNEDDDSAAAKFGYHVDLEEVKEFLAVRPKEAPLFVPSPWPHGALGAVLDLDQDDIPDSLAFGMQKEEVPTGILVDLTGENNVKADFSPRDVAAKQSWKFQFAVQTFPASRTFYDTDAKDGLDLILHDRDGDGVSDEELTLADGKWTRSREKPGPMFNADLYTVPALRKRFDQLLRNLVR